MAEQNGWQKFWSELGRRAVAYYDQSQVGNQATAAMAESAALSLQQGSMESDTVLGSFGSQPKPESSYSAYGAAGDGFGLDTIYGGSHLLNNLSGQSESLRAQSQENYAAYLRSVDLLERQQQFSERMSNTALQRQMADAEAAGINPYYLFGGNNSGAGVAAPSGASSIGAPAAGGNSGAAMASMIGAIGSLVTAVIKAVA